MEFIKYSLFLAVFICSGQIFAQPRFSSQSCLNANYKMKMSQKGPLFGLLSQELVIDKKDCIIQITHKKYLPREWKVDVCREPVHIKVTSATGVDVAKKESDCIKTDGTRDSSNFCSQYFTMMDVIQDDGLIFAEGDRDNLNSAHGRTYCAYLLLKRYLIDSIVFSRYTEIPDIFIETVKPVISAQVKSTPESPEGLEKKEGDQATEPVKAD